MTRAIRNALDLPFNDGLPYKNACSARWAAAAIRTIIATSAMPTNHCRMDRRNTDSAKHQVSDVRCHRPPGDRDQGQTLAAREALSRKHQQIDAKIQHRAQNVRHDDADEPTQASEDAERHSESQMAHDCLLRRDRSHYKPYDVRGQKCV